MCVRTYIEEVCTKCQYQNRTIDSVVDACWWHTLSGRCPKETIAFKKIMFVGCKGCREYEFEYSLSDRISDANAEKWFDDDPDNPPKPKPWYHWKNSLPEGYVRSLMGDAEYEAWKAQECKGEEERKEEERVRKEVEEKEEQELRKRGAQSEAVRKRMKIEKDEEEWQETEKITSARRPRHSFPL